MFRHPLSLTYRCGLFCWENWLLMRTLFSLPFSHLLFSVDFGVRHACLKSSLCFLLGCMNLGEKLHLSESHQNQARLRNTRSDPGPLGPGDATGSLQGVVWVTQRGWTPILPRRLASEGPGAISLGCIRSDVNQVQECCPPRVGLFLAQPFPSSLVLQHESH